MIEGYIYAAWGSVDYLKHVVASVVTLRRYDSDRPVALLCDTTIQSILNDQPHVANLFDEIVPLQEKHQSIVGLKHNVCEYHLYDRNLYLDSDLIFLRNPDDLWTQLSIYDYTISGNISADAFFGARKDARYLLDILLNRRKKTLDKFGCTYMSRVQSGIIYASDREISNKVSREAHALLERKDETHFISRLKEPGRNLETCEWSLSLAMSRLGLPVHPWMIGHNSPQLDFIESFTRYDKDFENVECCFYSNEFVYSFRGLKSDFTRNLLLNAFTVLNPGYGEYMWVTPFTLHFGWIHAKSPFYEFANRTWKKLTQKRQTQEV